jgi:hypothetical protein
MGCGARTGELIHVNDGTGGKFGNGILAHPHLNGLLFEDCGWTLSYTQTEIATTVARVESTPTAPSERIAWIVAPATKRLRRHYSRSAPTS